MNDQKKATFQYTYSAREQEEVKKIRSKYLPREEDKMERLRRLAGIAVVALAYPLYARILKKERRRIAPEILRLTEELMK